MFLVRFDEGLAVGDLVDGKGVGASLGDAEQSDYPLPESEHREDGCGDIPDVEDCLRPLLGCMGRNRRDGDRGGFCPVRCRHCLESECHFVLRTVPYGTYPYGTVRR